MEKIIFLVFLSLSDRISIVTEHFVYNKGGGGKGSRVLMLTLVLSHIKSIGVLLWCVSGSSRCFTASNKATQEVHKADVCILAGMGDDGWHCDLKTEM